MNSTGEVWVAVVDDCVDHCDVVSMMLEDSGYLPITYSGNKAEFLKLVPVLMPAAIITDIHSPGMDGLEFLQALKADPDLDHIPVIIASAYTDLERWCRAMRLGAAEYLEKPFDFEELSEVLERIFEREK